MDASGQAPMPAVLPQSGRCAARSPHDRDLGAVALSSRFHVGAAERPGPTRRANHTWTRPSTARARRGTRVTRRPTRGRAIALSSNPRAPPSSRPAGEEVVASASDPPATAGRGYPAHLAGSMVMPPMPGFRRCRPVRPEPRVLALVVVAAGVALDVLGWDLDDAAVRSPLEQAEHHRVVIVDAVAITVPATVPTAVAAGGLLGDR